MTWRCGSRRGGGEEVVGVVRQRDGEVGGQQGRDEAVEDVRNAELLREETRVESVPVQGMPKVSERAAKSSRRRWFGISFEVMWLMFRASEWTGSCMECGRKWMQSGGGSPG